MHSWALYVFFTSLYLNTNVHITTSLKIKTFDQPLRYDGIFTNFLRLLFDTLIDFPRIQGTAAFTGLSPYVFILSKCVGEMGYRTTTRLSKALERLSDKQELDIKDTIRRFKRDLDALVPKRIKFLEAMDSIFTSEQNLLFRDYIRQLLRYGRKQKEDMVEETRVLLNYVILYKVMGLGTRERRRLKKKLRKAIKEFNGRTYLYSSELSEQSSGSGDASTSYSSFEYLKKYYKLTNASHRIITF